MRKNAVDYITCIGSRELNEDAVCIREENGFLIAVAADGLGGHDRGEAASRLVAETIAQSIALPPEEPAAELEKAMETAQERLLELQRRENCVHAMKTTAVALLIVGSKAYFGHVGDSRGYKFYRWGKPGRTLDHSVPQMLALSGQIREEDIRCHPDRNSLLRVFGSPWERKACEIGKLVRIRRVKAFLLCTDGFWELISEREMQECLRRAKTPREWLALMQEIVEKNGEGREMDNYTALAVFPGTRGRAVPAEQNQSG